MDINRGLLKHIIFWLFYITAFWGAFEQAYNAPGHPLWSDTWSLPLPVPHHYVVGFIGMGVAYFLFTMEDWTLHDDIREELERIRAEMDERFSG
ncbi:MAG: hypothetical protein PVJ38_06740 [Candidatus Bathyarchaeota archaeon]|jgi:hypothetical protein